ncbi:MAG: RDD family protein [Clostridia bacterium]|nr:RDD family protein [Clostridia bacterium]
MIYDLQKANMWKRISAYIFDVILLGIAAVGFALLISAAVNYDGYSENLQGLYQKYEELYGVSFDITEEDYLAYSEEEAANYEAAIAALSADAEVNYTYSMMLNLTLLITTFGILFAYLILELLVPSLFKNGQTLGKKIFGIGVMRIDGIRISTPILFVRTVLCKYTIETMVPVLLLIMIYFNIVGIVGTAIIGLILLVQLILLIATRARTPIHDVIANTVTVDLSSQMIFDTQEDMIAYRQKIHTEQVEKSDDR